MSLLVRDAVFALAITPLIFYVIAAYAAWRFFAPGRRGAGPTRNDFTPSASILKPVCGLDRGAYENFASHCRQNYPEYEVLFAAHEDDPAVPIIRQLMRDFPDRPGRSIRLLIGVEVAGSNDKVTKLCRLARDARHGLLVMSDSDVRVGPDYLRMIAAPFADKQVGAVTALYRALEAPTFGAVMDAVGSSGSLMSAVLVGRAIEGLRFTIGATMATRREILQEIGGFESLLDLHSDDYEFGRRIADRGYRVELASQPIDMQFPSESLGAHLRRELRWLVGLRHVRPKGYLGTLFTLGIAWAVAAALVSPTTAAAAAWLGAYLTLRLGSSYMVGAWGLKDPVLRRWLWLLPLFDLLYSINWLVSFFVNRLEWRGTVFTLDRGRMVRVTPPLDPS